MREGYRYSARKGSGSGCTFMFELCFQDYAFVRLVLVRLEAFLRYGLLLTEVFTEFFFFFEMAGLHAILNELSAKFLSRRWFIKIIALCVDNIFCHNRFTLF